MGIATKVIRRHRSAASEMAKQEAPVQGPRPDRSPLESVYLLAPPWITQCILSYGGQIAPG